MCDSCDVLRREAFASEARCSCRYCPSPSVARECPRCRHSLVLTA